MERIKCVLLVDDDSSANFISKNVISKLDCAEEVLVAQNGKEALHIIEDRCLRQVSDDCPQLIFLDVKMPVMDGFEFMKEFESLDMKTRKKPVVIMLTTSTNPIDVQMAQQFQIAEFLNKPLRKDTLSHLLDKYFRLDTSSSVQPFAWEVYVRYRIICRKSVSESLAQKLVCILVLQAKIDGLNSAEAVL